jgi:aquaporin Z
LPSHLRDHFVAYLPRIYVTNAPARGKSPNSRLAGLIAEIVLTFIFLTVIIGATSAHAPVGFAGIAIGLTLTLIHLIGIPITNVSVNPARSTGPALFVGGWALHQLWLFWVAPIVGAILAGVVGSIIHEET